ncbi:MAG: response regulator [Dysgonamonadaceae bacterium]|jgi:signal transduction histidine kinase/CheY-like chemotaxis protein/HPt (histidine-containing phosphotransfer) domain-containing protein|nr:response regulator [Dysgonamonadaceae bacterium]
MPKKRAYKIKLLIIIGYSILLLLVVYGVVRIYSELRRFSEQESPFEERKEFVKISDVLASLYESEAMSRTLFSSTNTRSGLLAYDSLQNLVVLKIDSLKDLTTDTFVSESLDSVLVLLNMKCNNTHSIFQLMDSINRVPFKEKSITTLLSRKQIADLNNLSKIYTQQKQQDSVIVQVQKKTFSKRLSDVFRSNVKDSVFVKTRQANEQIDSIIPFQIVEDTIASFVTDVLLEYDRKRELLTAQLLRKQEYMYQTNSYLTSQIDNILKELEYQEYTKLYRFVLEKEKTLEYSSNTVLYVALAALITVIVFLGISLRSISRELRYQKQLEDAKKYAEELLKNRERLMLTISHDIKAPLSSIIGYIELLTKSKLPEKDKYYLQNMRYSSEQVLELLTKLLDSHRLKSGSMEIHSMYFSPHRLMEDIYRSFVPLVGQKELSFEFINHLDANDYYQSDPFRIRQIVNNLLTNAIKFTHSGQIMLSVSVLPKDGKLLLNIVVKDTGMGIAPENTEKIFEEYLRLEDAESMKIEGSGLGLAISRKLAVLLDGDIRVVSEKGKGSEFTLTIPLRKEPDTKREANLSSQREDPLRILFVDDDPVLLNMYAESLKREGFLPVITTSSLDVLPLLHKMSFDIVFTDIQMPDMNGFELVERIRMATFSRAGEIPVIALSACSDVSGQKFKEAGFSGAMLKPFSLGQLLDVIASYSGIPTHKKENLVGKGLSALTAFADKDKDAAINIIQTYIGENATSIESLKKSVETDDWVTLRALAHKLLPLMRMIDADEIVTVLYEIENNVQEKAKIYTLIEMLKQKNEDAEVFLAEISASVVANS